MRVRHFTPDGAASDLPGRWAVRVARRPVTSPVTGRARRPAAGLATVAVLLAIPAMLPAPASSAPSTAFPPPVSDTPVVGAPVSGPPAMQPWAGGMFASAAPSTGPAATAPRRETSPRAASPRAVSPRAVSPQAASSQAVSPQAAPSRPAPPRTAPVTALLRLSGAVPARGEGRFDVAAGAGRVLGTSGALRRFRVAVERGSGEAVAAFATKVEATLGDARGWTGGGGLRLQRVGPGAPYDFTVYLATRETAGRMCLRGGVDIRVGGRPYTSCRAPGAAIINLDRWRTSAPTFTAARVPLLTYRTYVINHEVGHELGRRHEGCPRRGGPAPVMVQQTLTLRGCTPYPWPRRAGRPLSGPLL